MKKELTRQVFEENAEQVGLVLGRAIRGKGTEVFTRAEKIFEYSHYWEKDFDKIKKYIDRNDVYVGSLQYRDEQDIPHVYTPIRPGQSAYSVKEVFEMGKRKIMNLSIYLKPKLIGYIPLSHYDSKEFDEQVEFITDLLNLKGIDMIEEDEYVFDPSREPDYIVPYNEGAYVSESLYEETLDGRVDCGNSYVLDDFWERYQDICDMSDIDPDGDVIVYTRKGKDWYITPALELESYDVAYLEEDYEEGYHIEYDRFDGALYRLGIEDLVEKVRDRLADIKRGIELESCVYNAAGLDVYDYDDMYEDIQLNMNILLKEYEDKWDIKNELMEYLQDHGYSPEKEVRVAYESMLLSKLDERKYLFGKYKHLPMLEKIAKQEGANLFYDKGSEVTEPLYAIEYRGEVYHFELRELYFTHPKAFFEKVLEKLQKRVQEKLKKRYLYQHAKEVFVGFDDSIKSGNCAAGTKDFIHNHAIDTKKIGGIRGDEILKMATPSEVRYAERAVMQAIKRLKGELNG